MRVTPLVLGSVLAMGAQIGCSETPAPVVPTVTDTPPTGPAQVAGGPIDLAPVAEPADIFVVARWKNPNATFRGLTGCAGVPDNLVMDDPVHRLAEKAFGELFRGSVDGRQIADIVAYDAPVDFVVALDTTRRTPNAFFSFSVGLTSLDRAKQLAGGELVEVAPGLYRLGAKDGGELSCVVGAAAGSAPARVICGQRDKDIAALGPYLARNVPVSEPPKHDVHAELRFAPIEARYGGDIRRGLGFLPNYARARSIGEPRFDAALDEAANALAEEGAALAGDLDRISFDLSVDPSTCFTGKAALQLRDRKSWLAGAIDESSTKSGPPPAIFWRAPVDSDSASYGRTADPARYNGMLRTLRGLLEGGLAKEKLGSEADRKALASLLHLPFGKDTSFVTASGHVAGAAKHAPAGGKLSEQQIADEVMQGSLGWYLFGFDEGPDGLSKLIKDVVAVYGRKGLTDPLRKELGNKAKMMPTVKLVAPPRELGRGGLDLEIKFEVESKRGEKPVIFTIHALVMPDGKSTWLAIGANRDGLVKQLGKVKAGAPDSGTLAARGGLDALRSGKAVSSGFFTLNVITRSLGSVLSNPALTSNASSRDAAAMEEINRALGNLPHKGSTPIFVSTEASKEPGPRSETSVQIAKGTFEDLGVLLMTGVRLAQKSGALKKAAP